MVVFVIGTRSARQNGQDEGTHTRYHYTRAHTHNYYILYVSGKSSSSGVRVAQSVTFARNRPEDLYITLILLLLLIRTKSTIGHRVDDVYITFIYI